jgi:hypothetical protein
MMDPELLLRGPDVGQVAAALELALRTHRRNGHPPGNQLRDVAAKVAQAVPLVAACLPALLDAAGPEAAAAVRAKVNGTAGSAAGVRSAPLASSQAARIACVSDRAVRAACASGRLAATKSRITGEWLIDPGGLREWTESRRVA